MLKEGNPWGHGSSQAMPGIPVGVAVRKQGLMGILLYCWIVGAVPKEGTRLGTHLSGRRVRSSRRTLNMPRILVPLSETMDTRMSMMEMSTSSPSRTFQLLRRYACSPKHQPSATTWGRPRHHCCRRLPEVPSPVLLLGSISPTPFTPETREPQSNTDPLLPSRSSLPKRLQ